MRGSRWSFDGRWFDRGFDGYSKGTINAKVESRLKDGLFIGQMKNVPLPMRLGVRSKE